MRALLPFLVACHVAYPDPSPTPEDRAAVIVAECGGVLQIGTGVVVGPHEVLTAAHVIFRLPPAHWCSRPLVRVDTGLDVFWASSWRADPDRDLASLGVGDTHFPPAPVAPVTAAVGCAHVQVPERAVNCGPVTPGGVDDVGLGFPAVPGNSGGGVWIDGSLVALITHGADDGRVWGTAVLPGLR